MTSWQQLLIFAPKSARQADEIKRPAGVLRSSGSDARWPKPHKPIDAHSQGAALSPSFQVAVTVRVHVRRLSKAVQLEQDPSLRLESFGSQVSKALL